MVDAFELLELLAENRQLVSETYNFFLTVQLAIFGLVFIANNRVSLRERAVIIFAYVGFTFVNYMAQADNYAYQSHLVEQVMALSDDPRGQAAKALVGSPEMPWIFEHLAMGYILVAAISCAIIMAAGYLNKE